MRILVVGATDEAVDIVKNLIEKGHEVIMLDDNKARIDKIVQELDVAAYVFSTTDLTSFQQAGIHRADMVLTMHPVDTVNMLACIFAKHFNVPKILAVVSSIQTADILKRLGLADNVLVRSKAVSRALMEFMYDVKLVDIDEEHYLVILVVKDGLHIEGKTVGDIEEEEIRVLTVMSSDNVPIGFNKDYVFKKDDKVILIVRKDKLESVLFKR